jgi:hypothetical protein
MKHCGYNGLKNAQGIHKAHVLRCKCLNKLEMSTEERKYTNKIFDNIIMLHQFTTVTKEVKSA